MQGAVQDDERVLAELRDLRRDIGEASALATRTHTGLTTLATTLKDVVARQDRYERGLNLNSFVAYTLFTVLLGGGFYLLYRSRAEHLVGDREAALRLRADALQQAAAARAALATHEAGSKKAAELYALYKDGRRADVIARYPEAAGAQLSPVEAQVLEESVGRARGEIADASFAAGIEAAKAEQWKRAVTELKRALGFEPDGARALQARYWLGVALLKQGDFAEAVVQLDKALAGGAERSAVDARFQLATALEQAKQLERARNEYVKFADAHYLHPLAGTARRRASLINATIRGSTPGTGPQ
jgi:TolA-binding protein